MKPSTLLLVAGAFVAGVSLGASAPLVKAGDGLVQLFAEALPMPARAIHVSAVGETKRSGFQPADFRWSAHSATEQSLVCAPNGQFGHDMLPAIQHL